MSVDWVLSTGDVIEVGTMSGATTRTMVHSVEIHPNGHADWVRLIVGGGAVLLLRKEDVKIVKRFDAPEVSE